jgi:hypothetical protein
MERPNLVQVTKYAIYEIPINQNSSGTQYNFPTNNYLVGKEILGLEVFIDSDIRKSPISTSNATWTHTMMITSTLTLHCFDPNKPNDTGGKADWIKGMPCAALHRQFNTNGADAGSSVFQKMFLGGLVIDWNNSHIDFVTAPAPAANYSALFGVSYR